MIISEQEVRHIAGLAKLKLSDEEVEKFSIELGQIAEFVDELKKVDVSQVDPTAYIVDKKNVLREDILTDSMDRALILKNAPSKEAGCISVPKVVE